MRIFLLFCILSIISSSESLGQDPSDEKSTLLENLDNGLSYRQSRTKFFDLIHTRLAVAFDWEKQYLHGEAELTLKPHFLDQKELVLDAKGMKVHSVGVGTSDNHIKVDFLNDENELLINLDQYYGRLDTVQIVIKYTAKPNERTIAGSDAIKSDKGLYFINPLGLDKNKPRQVWTQGETESNSVWFPTLDAPNQKSTQEIYITVKDQFKTLSNGVLMSSTTSTSGLRTDYWKMDKPHAPYLFMMVVGDYAIVEDKWEDTPLSYYVEKEFEPYARSIFGNTPEMMDFFSKQLNYSYPWPKYAQVVVRDYVSGAMENTSASVFMEALQATDRELLDFNWDDIVAHELFHQWFGDLVTCESWSNLTLNEGFATYGEFLWDEYKYGADVADYNFSLTRQGYFDEAEATPKNLIRYYYKHREDMFDSHSYAKGALVLHMLRNYLGDAVFFESLGVYLKNNAFRSVELANLRLAFEEVSGEDLLWFFDQWFLFPGHPELKVEHSYKADTLYLEVEQRQNGEGVPLYKLPVFVELWYGDSAQQYPLMIAEEFELYKFPVDKKPDLVLFDANNQLLAEIEHDKSDEELEYQFKHADFFTQKVETLVQLDGFKSNSQKESILEEALKDEFYGIRQAAIEYCIVSGLTSKSIAKIMEGLVTDPNSYVRASALDFLGSLKFSKYRGVVSSALQDSSYTVVGMALNLFLTAEEEITPIDLKKLSQEKSIHVVVPLAEYYTANNVAGKFQWFKGHLETLSGNALFYFVQSFAKMMIQADDSDKLKSIPVLENLARTNSNYMVRLAGYQALLLQNDLKGVKGILDSIRTNEKDQRLIELYDQMQFD